MIARPRSIPRVLAAAGFATLTLTGYSTLASAQTPTNPAPASADTAKIEKIEVTGSNIKRVDAETSVPVTIISSEDIKRSGATSVQELLNNLTISSGSALTDVSGGFGFSTGAATAALRGLGSAATLTLLNGRRISPAAFNDPNVGSTVITNLNSIPTAAIERIEILRDGASAVYGSDAIAGVINIILRKDFTGATVTGTVSQSPRNEFLVKQGSVAFGFGDLAKDRYNVFGTYERFEREPVLIKSEDNVDTFLQDPTYIQRLSVLSSLSYPGNYYREAVRGSNIFNTLAAVRAGCPANLVIGGLCRYNQWNDLEQSGASKRDTAYVRGTMDFSANLSGFAEASFSRTTNTFTGAPPASNPQTATVWRNPAGQLLSFQLVLPVGHRENPYAFPIGLRYRWVDMGRFRDISRTTDSRVLVGLKGTGGSWDWESSYLWNTSKANVNSGRRFLYPAIQTAVNDGSYRFDGQNSQEVIDRVSAYTTNVGEGTAKILDFKASREWGRLAGGAIGIAVGAEFRKDDIVITPDRNIANGNIVGLGASFANGSRDTKSAYAEVVLPITASVEATLAGRHDRYSDFGSTTNPKIGLKWKALSNLVLRSSYSTGFRAPTLSQTSRSAIRSFQAVNDPIRCPVTNTNEDCGRIASISAQIVFNPDLGPETSSSRNLGLVWDVTRNLNLSLDYFDIRREDEIDRFSSNFQVNQLFLGDQRFAPFVFRDPNPLSWIPGVPNSGPVIGVNRAWLNLGKSQVTGLDLDVTHRARLGQWGRLTSTFTGTYNISSKQSREKNQPMIDYVGGVNTAVTGLGIPRFRGNVGTTWEFGDWSFGGRINYIGGWNNFSSQFNCAANVASGQAAINTIPGVCKVKPWRTVDVNATYTGIKNLTIRVVVRNVTDEKPPFDYYGGDVTLGYNPNFHNPLGIYPSISATYRF
jgi:iron complex outermembrane receptor protein